MGSMDLMDIPLLPSAVSTKPMGSKRESVESGGRVESHGSLKRQILSSFPWSKLSRPVPIQIHRPAAAAGDDGASGGGGPRSVSGDGGGGNGRADAADAIVSAAAVFTCRRTLDGLADCFVEERKVGRGAVSIRWDHFQQDPVVYVRGGGGGGRVGERRRTEAGGGDRGRCGNGDPPARELGVSYLGTPAKVEGSAAAAAAAERREGRRRRSRREGGRVLRRELRRHVAGGGERESGRVGSGIVREVAAASGVVGHDALLPTRVPLHQGVQDRGHQGESSPFNLGPPFQFQRLSFFHRLAAVEELRAWYGLEFVTSSLEKKSAAAIRAKLEVDSTRPLPSPPVASSLAYEVAASAASYVHSGAKLIEIDVFHEQRMDVLVHRGIYEAAKGIYEQFLPEVAEHLRRYGDGARFRFTGHSLGGSLCILVAFMLLARGNVERRHLHPVVTFGTPSVFCGGERVLQALGLDDGFVLSVMMHLDIVPRAFSCDYPDQVAQLLKRLNGAFRSHPCLNNQALFLLQSLLPSIGLLLTCDLVLQKVLYSPLGRTYILQPDDQSSPYHPLLPQDSALYVFDGKHTGKEGGQSQAAAASASALRAFINSPHPLETLSDPRAYGSEGTILRDHDSSNYARAIAGLIRRHNKHLRRRSRKQRLEQWWPLLTSAAAGSCAGHQNPILQKPPQLVPNEVATTTTKGF
ncbi:hypothetical protein ZIOFF_017354 [Zingiber officinale]|uniref:Fungal lipase-type domain-containing protein n=1 Tax=Zingiber officinale TaxID=94328 RepID=A0A8J5LI86_ZINOF|nr:hypothetical protein ZIOFF_017354 [Zingiber officinale]